MSRKAKAKRNEKTGRFEKNGAKRKAGLNKSILDKGWCQLENYIKYKAHRKNKVLFKPLIAPNLSFPALVVI